MMLKEYKRKFIISTIVTIPILILSSFAFFYGGLLEAEFYMAIVY